MNSAQLTKEKARELLQMYIRNHNGILPMYDANISIRSELDNQFTITEYTFRYLLQVAYDLTTIKLTGL
jgi:hypothetical protein